MRCPEAHRTVAPVGEIGGLIGGLTLVESGSRGIEQLFSVDDAIVERARPATLGGNLDLEAERAVAQRRPVASWCGSHREAAAERRIDVYGLEAVLVGIPLRRGFAPHHDPMRLHVEKVGEVADHVDRKVEPQGSSVVIAQRQHLPHAGQPEQARERQADATRRHLAVVLRQRAVDHHGLRREMRDRRRAQKLPRPVVDRHGPGADQPGVTVEKTALARLMDLPIGLGDQHRFADVDRQLRRPDADLVAHGTPAPDFDGLQPMPSSVARHPGSASFPAEACRRRRRSADRRRAPQHAPISYAATHARAISASGRGRPQAWFEHPRSRICFIALARVAAEILGLVR